MEEAYQKFEESEEHIQDRLIVEACFQPGETELALAEELLDRGAITNDEARKLRTRAKMHQQDAAS